MKISNHKNKIEISARFRSIFDFELNGKRSQAEPSRAENPSARLGLITSSRVVDNILELFMIWYRL